MAHDWESYQVRSSRHDPDREQPASRPSFEGFVPFLELRRRVICPFWTVYTNVLRTVTSIPSRPHMWEVFEATT
jgi:hypothetical protein